MGSGGVGFKPDITVLIMISDIAIRTSLISTERHSNRLTRTDYFLKFIYKKINCLKVFPLQLG